MHEKYGDIVRVAPNELSFAKGQAWTDIFSHRPGHHEFPRNPVWWKPAPGSPPSIINVGPEDHARIRSVLSKAFSLKALADQEPVLQRNVALLISRFEELAGKHGVELDITKWYNYTTFDIIGDVATGETFDCLNTASYHWWVATIFNHFKASSYLACIRFYPALEWLLLKFIPRKMREVQRAHYEEGASKVRRRLEKGRDDNSSDFLSLVLKNNSANGMKMDEIEATFNLIFFAGSETTATTLSGATNGLIRHPEVQTRLRAELHETFRDPSQMTFSELQKLPYLNAVIEEALRMYPTLPSGLPRLVPEGGDTVCGEMIPGGVSASVKFFPMNDISLGLFLLYLICLNGQPVADTFFDFTDPRPSSHMVS
jgi:cytochrome P450